MRGYRRYAIYHAPEKGSALAEFGADWLGWDAETGRERPHPDLAGLDPARITEAPRKYGLHGTLKPPFRLAEGKTVEALDAAVAELARRRPPVTLEGLAVHALGGFVALVPEGDVRELRALAGACVGELDAFRAPPEPEELARRRHAGLTTAQEKLLTDWGYPFVFEEFRFHITLTGRLEESEREVAVTALSAALSDKLPRPFPIRELAMFGEAGDGRFRLLRRYHLKG